MKLIGITGSCGKTSVAEIVYQYLLYIGIPVSLYSSNGNFVNGLTRVKDYLQTTLYRKDLDELLHTDEENGIEYAIIEITAESVKRKDTVHMLPYEVIAMTNFYSGLSNHFDSKEEYLMCKREILSKSSKKLLLWIEDRNYDFFKDLDHQTYGYANNANYQLIVVDNTINGLDLNYKGVSFKTNLITAYHARNVSCALAILDSLSLLKMEVFKEFSKNVFIRGRFEKFICKGKNIVIDTGFLGADMLLIGLEKILGNRNFKTIFSIHHYDEVTEWVKKSRKRVGEYLKWSKFIYLTNPLNKDNALEIFRNDVVGLDYNNYKYISDPEEAVRMALNELNEDETIVIFAREHYRKYRSILENICGVC
mgnify:CR=1 FL=1